MSNINEPVSKEPSPESNVKLLEDGIINAAIAMSSQFQKQGCSIEEAKKKTSIFLTQLSSQMIATKESHDT